MGVRNKSNSTKVKNNVRICVIFVVIFFADTKSQCDKVFLTTVLPVAAIKTDSVFHTFKDALVNFDDYNCFEFNPLGDCVDEGKTAKFTNIDEVYNDIDLDEYAETADNQKAIESTSNNPNTQKSMYVAVLNMVFWLIGVLWFLVFFLSMPISEFIKDNKLVEPNDLDFIQKRFGGLATSCEVHKKDKIPSDIIFD